MVSSKILLLPVIGVTTFFVLLFGFTRLFGPIPFSVSSAVTNKSTTFDVTGEGKVAAVPDIAVVNVGVAANGQTVKQAQDILNTNINKISDAIKKLGVDSQDIQTSNYNINPTMDYTGSSQKITGYAANSNLVIKVRKVDQANTIIDAATANGANQVGGVSFEVDNKANAENEARQKAVEDAKRKAELASKTVGFKLGRIINYTENFGNNPRPVPLKAQTGIGGPNTTNVEPGTSEINITVTLSYEIL